MLRPNSTTSQNCTFKKILEQYVVAVFLTLGMNFCINMICQSLWKTSENFARNNSCSGKKKQCINQFVYTPSKSNDPTTIIFDSKITPKIFLFKKSLKLIHTALCIIFTILVSHENVKKCALGGCTITPIIIDKQQSDLGN